MAKKKLHNTKYKTTSDMIMTVTTGTKKKKKDEKKNNMYIYVPSLNNREQ